MRKHFIIILFIVSSILFSDPIFGQTEISKKSETDTEIKINYPIKYDLRINVLDVSNIDLRNGSIDFVFWVYLKSNDVNFHETPPPVLDFVNLKQYLIQNEIIEKHRYKAKIFGTFFLHDINFENYPFMKLNPTIQIESESDTTKTVEFFIKDQLNFPSSDFPIPGWNVHSQDFKIVEDVNRNTDVYSRYIAEFTIEKPFFPAFIVGLFPIIVMAMIALIVMLFKPTNLDIRAEVLTGILIAAVFFHVLDVGAELPPLETLTLEDKGMMGLYSILIIAMMELVIQRKYNPSLDIEKAEKINKKIRYSIPPIVLTVLALGWVFG